MDKAVFVQNIKYYCKIKGVKPTVACRESGVSSSFITNVESKGSAPSVEKVQMLAQYLGVTVSELLGEGLSDVPAVNLQIAEAYDRADPGTRAAVRKLLDVADEDLTGERG